MSLMSRACGRPVIGCVRRCSTGSSPRSSARDVSISLPAVARWASKRPRAVRSRSRSSSLTGSPPPRSHAPSRRLRPANSFVSNVARPMPGLPPAQDPTTSSSSIRHSTSLARAKCFGSWRPGIWRKKRLYTWRRRARRPSNRSCQTGLSRRVSEPSATSWLACTGSGEKMIESRHLRASHISLTLRGPETGLSRCA